ncbi:methyltransferase domain-containing protein [Candidatus Roizmanbacteria bacterium]|nr:methyltransferase domain-containing protein [Candidatus Roizmanbacteria bacterium]
MFKQILDLFKQFDIIPFALFIFSMNTEYRNVALLGRFGVDHRSRSGFAVSEAHNITHLRNDADLTQLVGDIYGFSERERFLAYIAGWFHDLIRSPSEDPAVKDDQASANESIRILQEACRRGITQITSEEQEAIAYAISNHGRYPEWFRDPKTRNIIPESLEDKMLLALFVADKMEANGVRVIARRSSFVAGDRLRSEKGDWRQFGFKPDQDEGFVVAIESLLRLSFINPEDIYPEVLQPLVHPLYEVQREFVVGVCRALDLNVSQLVELILHMKNGKQENILEARKIEAPREFRELARVIGEKSGITDAIIKSATDDQLHSAYETVMYFSEHYKDNLDQLILDWNPNYEMAKAWQKRMINYDEGTWLDDKKREFAVTRTLSEHTPHNESLMPLVMGSPNRTPSYTIANWGVQKIDEQTVVNLYRAEWAQGTKDQLALVSQAAEKAGLGNHPELLRQKTAQVISAILENHPTNGNLRILDVGAGPGLSTLAIWLTLPEEARSKVEMILLDPSSQSLDAAEQLIIEYGVNYQRIDGVDLDIPQHLFRPSVDVLTGVASIHHHSQIPFEIYHNVLKPGGFAIFADWHNSIWEHPARVYQFLQSFDWPNKQVGLKHWLETYPQAKSAISEPEVPAERQANIDITNFWLAYAEIVKQNGHLGSNAIWPLEGHRPVREYVKAMQQAGLRLDSDSISKLIRSGVINANPYQLLPDSSLLMLTIGQKPKK